MNCNKSPLYGYGDIRSNLVQGLKKAILCLKLDERKITMKKLKICVIGIKGGISTVLMSGLFKSIRRGVPAGGLLTDTPLFSQCSLPDVNTFEFGGFDIRQIDLYESALQNDQFNVLRLDTEPEIKEWLNSIPIYKGVTLNCGNAISNIAQNGFTHNHGNLREAVSQVSSDLNEFRGKDDCVMVNLSSTEERFVLSENHLSLEGFEKALDNNATDITPGQIYAYSAIKEGIPYVNFTPSTCADIPALVELSNLKKVPQAGKDGKTGETLVKTVLCDMFSIRNLNVDMWYGTNILGNLDGKILDNSNNKSSKIESKKSVLKGCLGYEPASEVRIDYMKPMGDNKVAWDYILFSGFGGAKMTMTFTWQGIDSFLAAPLVVDLVRLIHLALQKGFYGIQNQFAVFFKSPLNTDVNSLVRQYDILKEWVKKLKEA